MVNHDQPRLQPWLTTTGQLQLWFVHPDFRFWFVPTSDDLQMAGSKLKVTKVIFQVVKIVLVYFSERYHYGVLSKFCTTFLVLG